jgi:aconitate hydratase
MGQAPATRQISLRTVPRNFPGRSGVTEDKVYLVSPETAAASALTGVITDPRDLGRTLKIKHPRVPDPSNPVLNTDMVVPPLPPGPARAVQLVKGPNITALPAFDPLPNALTLPVLLRVGDDISTDGIIQGGEDVLPLRSNIEEISKFVFQRIDKTYHDRAWRTRDKGGHAIVAGANYGQGSSREHAALAPRYLGLHVVLARSFARIHQQNLVNFGILPLEIGKDEYDRIQQGDVLSLADLHQQIRKGAEIAVVNDTQQKRAFTAHHKLTARQIDVLLAGGLINWVGKRLKK